MASTPKVPENISVKSPEPQDATSTADVINSDTVKPTASYSNRKASLLDNGEDFEMLNDDDYDDDMSGLPPLEDTEAAKQEEENRSETVTMDPSSESIKGAESKCGDSTESADKVEDWIDVLGNGLLRKKTLVAGKGENTRPLRGQLATISVKTALEDGTVVEEEPSVTFTLGDGDVMQAVDLCVHLMQAGEKALVHSDARYAYGSQGRLPDIPPSVSLQLEVELLEVKDCPDLEILTGTAKSELANQKRERGNYYYQRAEYVYAINSYDVALRVIDSTSKVEFTPDEEAQLLDVKVKCLNNLAASQLKLEHFEAALKSCNSVLNHQPENVKALFRKGKVLALQGEYAEAIAILKRALKLEPSNKTIHAELSKLVKKHTEQKNVETAMYKKMLGNTGSAPAKHNRESSWNFPWKWLFGATVVAIGGVALSVIIASRN